MYNNVIEEEEWATLYQAWTQDICSTDLAKRVFYPYEISIPFKKISLHMGYFVWRQWWRGEVGYTRLELGTLQFKNQYSTDWVRGLTH